MIHLGKVSIWEGSMGRPLGLAVPGATQPRQGLGRASDMPLLLLPESGQARAYGQSSSSALQALSLSATWAQGPPGASESLHSQRWNLLSVQMRKPRWGVRLCGETGTSSVIQVSSCAFSFSPGSGKIKSVTVFLLLFPLSGPHTLQSLFYSCSHLNSYHP